MEKIKYMKDKENLFSHSSNSLNVTKINDYFLRITYYDQKNTLGKNHEEIKILVEDQESLKKSHSIASQAIGTGLEVLNSFKRQHDMLKVKKVQFFKFFIFFLIENTKKSIYDFGGIRDIE